MSDFVELFVLKQRDDHVGENPGNIFKNGAVFDVLPRFWLYETCLLSSDAREMCVQDVHVY